MFIFDMEVDCWIAQIVFETKTLVPGQISIVSRLRSPFFSLKVFRLVIRVRFLHHTDRYNYYLINMYQCNVK